MDSGDPVSSLRRVYDYWRLAEDPRQTSAVEWMTAAGKPSFAGQSASDLNRSMPAVPVRPRMAPFSILITHGAASLGPSFPVSALNVGLAPPPLE